MALPDNAYNLGFVNPNAKYASQMTLYGILATSEGNKAIDDAIKFLQGLRKSYPLYWSDGLYNATKGYNSEKSRNESRKGEEFTARIKSFESKSK